VQYLLVLKNIIFGRGPNMALWRFCVRSQDKSFHQVNFGVNSYFRFFFFNVDSDLLLFCHVQGRVARPSQSIMWNGPPWLTKSTSPPSCCNVLFSFEQKNKLHKQWNFWNKYYLLLRWRQIVFTESLNKRTIELIILVLYSQNGCQMLGPLGEFFGVFGYLIGNQYIVEHLKSASV
jgi:hypothetical protein